MRVRARSTNQLLQPTEQCDRPYEHAGGTRSINLAHYDLSNFRTLTLSQPSTVSHNQRAKVTSWKEETDYVLERGVGLTATKRSACGWHPLKKISYCLA